MIKFYSLQDVAHTEKYGKVLFFLSLFTALQWRHLNLQSRHLKQLFLCTTMETFPMAILLLRETFYTDILKGARTTFKLRQCSRELLKCM